MTDASPALLSRRGRTIAGALAGAYTVFVSAASAHAQPAQQLPPPAAAPPPARYQPPPGHSNPPPPTYGQAPPLGASNPDDPEPPLFARPSAPPLPPPTMLSTGAPIATASDVPEPHAPKYALWTGARFSYVGFGFSFYENDAQPSPQTESTGNFIGNGFAPQVDVGARLARRYVPYVFWEHGFMAQGHRFEGTGASSSTDFYGVGFRYVSGDIDSVGFLTDLSIGRRVVSISNGSQSYSMSGLEFFRLGLGAEIRVATLFALSPVASISSGALSDTKGSIDFACATTTCAGAGQVSRPTYVNGDDIRNSRAYVVLSLGVGIHFDVFGK